VIDTSLARPPAQRMLPTAVALAVGLHVLIAIGLWWLSTLPRAEAEEEPIMVLFDSSPSDVGLQTPERTGPPAESAAASPAPSAEPMREEQPQQQALAPPQPAATPEPQPVPPSQAEPQPEQVPTLPIYEFSIPPVPQPPPAPTSRDFPRPPAANRPRPVQRTQPMPPRPLPPAQQRPAAEAPAAMPAPIPGPNPADMLAGRGRMRNDYLSNLFRHLAPYRVRSRTARAGNQSGHVMSRVTVARDGSVLGVSIESSSGSPALDAAELEAIRSAAPFPPLPANMPGEPIVLHLRMTY
jgi:protein TonB